MQLVLFVYYIWCRKMRKYERDVNLIIPLKLDICWLNIYFSTWERFYWNPVKFTLDIFQYNYNIVHDSFETDSVNVMKNRPLVAKKQGNFKIY